MILLTTGLFVLAAWSVYLWSKRWSRACTWFCIGGGALLVFGCSGLLAYPMLSRLQVGYTPWVTKPWMPDTAIVVLGMGTERIPYVGNRQREPLIFAYGRITRAAELYRACSAEVAGCHVLVSGGDEQESGVSEAEVYGMELARLGVPLSAQIREDRSSNTWENAKFSSAILIAHHFSTVVLVTSGVHLKRSELYFAQFGTSVVPVRADFVNAQPLQVQALSYNLLLTDIALHEYIGIARLRIYNALGLNSPSIKRLSRASS